VEPRRKEEDRDEIIRSLGRTGHGGKQTTSTRKLERDFQNGHVELCGGEAGCGGKEAGGRNGTEPP